MSVVEDGFPKMFWKVVFVFNLYDNIKHLVAT